MSQPLSLFTILEELPHYKNEQRAAYQAHYMRNKFPFIGIDAKSRRELCKPYFAADNKFVINWDFVQACFDHPQREAQYIAIDYLKRKKRLTTPNDIEQIRAFIEQKSWWDTVDGFIQILGDLHQRHASDITPVFLAWSKDPNLWLRRAAIISQNLRRETTDVSLLSTVILANTDHPDFFIRKAIGWALRSYGKTNPEWVIAFVDKHAASLSPLSRNEALKRLHVVRVADNS